MMHHAFFDGASRSNPGHASYGAFVKNAEGQEVASIGRYIGINTNNVSEYRGCLAAVDLCIKLGIKRVTIYGDSKLVIEQVNGNWKCRSDNLKRFHKEIINKKNEYFEEIVFKHVRRALNKRADYLANCALDIALESNRTTD